MNCVKCNGPVLLNNYCSQCGVKMDYYKKAYNTSEYYYNLGLEKAEVRDLTGAVQQLKMSLKYNKCNTDARNLLGLIYYEMGEVVLALSEWVVSCHFQPDENQAVYYLNEIQENPSHLENVNQTIKKYNQTIAYAKQGSEDLALIQLKKVLSLSPNFVNGYLLLALLHIQMGNEEKARKALKRVFRIDSHNTLALKYMSEIGEGDNKRAVRASKTEIDEPREKSAFKRDDNMPRANINAAPVGKYMDPSSGIRSLMYIGVGMLIAAVVMWVLIIPSRIRAIENQYKDRQGSYSEELASKSAALTNMEEENKTLLKEKSDLQKELSQYTGDDGSGSLHDQIFKSAKLYLDGEKVQAAEALVGVDAANIESADAKKLYDSLAEATFSEASSQLYSEGKAHYDGYRYEEAKAALEKAYDLNNENVDALYFLARAYDRLNDNEKAREYYNKVMTDFPDSGRASEANSRLNALN